MGSPQQEGEVEKPHAKMPDWIRWESMLSCQLEAPNYFMCKSSNSNSFLLVLVHNLSGRDTHNQFRSINHTGVQLPLDLSFQQDCSPGNKHARPTLFGILIGKQKVYSLTAATGRVLQPPSSPKTLATSCEEVKGLTQPCSEHDPISSKQESSNLI